MLRVLGEIHRPVNRRDEGVQAEVAERHPQLHRPAHARQLETMVGEVHLTGGDEGVLEVVGVDLKGPEQEAALSDQECTALERLIQPLVGVERDGIGKLNACQSVPAASCDCGEPAVSSIDVQPDPVLLADGGDL